MNVRQFHRNVAPWLVLPLVVTILTGLSFRLGKSWFGMEKEEGWKILDVHTGEWMGTAGSLLWVGVTGLGLLAILLTGASLLRQRGGRQIFRRWHRVAAFILLLPLLATTLTGMIYRFGEAFFHTSEEFEDVLMMIHQGSWLGAPFTPVYVLLLGVGLLVLMATGVRLAIRKS